MLEHSARLVCQSYVEYVVFLRYVHVCIFAVDVAVSYGSFLAFKGGSATSHYDNDAIFLRLFSSANCANALFKRTIASFHFATTALFVVLCFLQFVRSPIAKVVTACCCNRFFLCPATNCASESSNTFFQVSWLFCYNAFVKLAIGSFHFATATLSVVFAWVVFVWHPIAKFVTTCFGNRLILCFATNCTSESSYAFLQVSWIFCHNALVVNTFALWAIATWHKFNSYFVCSLVDVDVVCTVIFHHNGCAGCLCACCASGKCKVGNKVVLGIADSKVIVTFQSKSKVAKFLCIVGIFHKCVGCSFVNVDVLWQYLFFARASCRNKSNCLCHCVEVNVVRSANLYHCNCAVGNCNGRVSTSKRTVGVARSTVFCYFHHADKVTCRNICAFVVNFVGVVGIYLHRQCCVVGAIGYHQRVQVVVRWIFFRASPANKLQVQNVCVYVVA